MKVNNYIEISEILAEVTSYCRDRSFKKNSKGWYTARVRDAVREMAIDSMYFKLTVDLDLPANLRLEMPKNFFFPDQVFVFNKESCCEPGDFKYVYWKKGMDNKYSATNNSHKILDSADDKFNQGKNDFADVGSALYCNEQNGMYVFSPSCSGYDSVRLVGRSLGGDINDDMIIPVIFKKYVVDYVVESYYKIEAAENPRVMRTIWRDMSNDLETSRIECESRVKRMTPHEKNTLFEWTSSVHK
jgi:hypothetical protein